MNTPTTTPIPVDLYRRLNNSRDKMVAIQQTMKMFQEQCEARMTQAQMELRDTWASIGALGIDVTNVVWEPHPTEPAITPKQMRLSD